MAPAEAFWFGFCCGIICLLGGFALIVAYVGGREPKNQTRNNEE